MKTTVTTIPQLLVETHGNQTEVARLIKSTRNTVHKYARDYEAKQHAIVNGVLMMYRGRSVKEVRNAATR